MQHELQIDGAMLLDEGIIDWIKAGAKYAKEGISKLAKSISNIFKNISKGVLSVVRKFNTRRETTKLLKRYSRYLSEAKTDKLPSQEKQVEAIAKNPKALKQLNDDMTDGVDKLWKRIDKINEKSTQLGEEGCLSIPDLKLEIKRYDKIKVRYYDIDGRAIRKPLDKFISRVYQHELDLLNGILMIEDKDRIKDGFIDEKIPKELFQQLLDRLSNSP